jgi:hypothetical protein
LKHFLPGDFKRRIYIICVFSIPGILLETVGEGSGGTGEEQKLVIHNRPAILVQRNLVLGNPSAAGKHYFRVMPLL